MKKIEFLYALKNARVRDTGIPGLAQQRCHLGNGQRVAAHGKRRFVIS